MKQIMIIICCCLFIYATTAQPLEPGKQLALVEYWNKVPELAKYSDQVKLSVVENPANANTLRICAKTAEKFQVLKQAKESTDLQDKYAKLKTLPSDYLNRVFPGFDLKQYRDATAIGKKIEKARDGKSIKGVLREVKGGEEFMNLYNKKRSEKSSAEAAIVYANSEKPATIAYLTEKWDKEEKAKKATNLTTIELILALLENNYLDNYSKKVEQSIDNEMTQIKNASGVCNNLAGDMLLKASTSSDKPVDWTGTYVEYKTLVTLNGDRANYTFA